MDVVKAAGFDLIILETSGIGQSDTEITEHSDMSLYVMTPEYGAATQLEKIDMLDFANIIALNKFDKRGALDALRDVKKQFKRNHQLWDADDDSLPVFGTIASQFNDPGMNRLYKAIMDHLDKNTKAGLKSDFHITDEMSEKIYIIPPHRTRYLSEISESNRQYNKWSKDQAAVAQSTNNTFASMSSNMSTSNSAIAASGLATANTIATSGLTTANTIATSGLTTANTVASNGLASTENAAKAGITGVVTTANTGLATADTIAGNGFVSTENTARTGITQVAATANTGLATAENIARTGITGVVTVSGTGLTAVQNVAKDGINGITSTGTASLSAIQNINSAANQTIVTITD